VNDDELDRLRIALLHAYDPNQTLPQRLAKALKDRMTTGPKPSHKTVVREKKDKDAA
jgi:hypothetical protein